MLDVHGNPVGRLVRKNIPECGSSTHRLGALREEVSQLIKWVKKQGVTVIAIEKLDFADVRAMGRQRGRRGKPGNTTRRKVCGIPTAKFAHTICSAAYRHNMVVIAVYPAYTSIWGARYGAKRKDSQHPRRLEDRCGRTTVQQNTRLSGMAPTTSNDRRERSLVGAVDLVVEHATVTRV